MVTMTIHVDDAFAEALRAHARRSGKSVNQTVKDLLAPILGLVKKRKGEADTLSSGKSNCILKKGFDSYAQLTLRSTNTWNIDRR